MLSSLHCILGIYYLMNEFVFIIAFGTCELVLSRRECCELVASREYSLGCVQGLYIMEGETELGFFKH